VLLLVLLLVLFSQGADEPCLGFATVVDIFLRMMPTKHKRQPYKSCGALERSPGMSSCQCL
jgi:hypothetical protein